MEEMEMREMETAAVREVVVEELEEMSLGELLYEALMGRGMAGVSPRPVG